MTLQDSPPIMVTSAIGVQPPNRKTNSAIDTKRFIFPSKKFSSGLFLQLSGSTASAKTIVSGNTIASIKMIASIPGSGSDLKRRFIRDRPDLFGPDGSDPGKGEF